MTRLQQIQKIMADLKARSGKNYAVQVKRGKAQLVILTRGAQGRSVVTPVTAYLPMAEVYAVAEQTELTKKA